MAKFLAITAAFSILSLGFGLVVARILRLELLEVTLFSLPVVNGSRSRKWRIGLVPGVTLLAFCVAIVLTERPCLAGDFCVVVCDDAAQRSGLRACPSPTFRTSAEIVSDFQLIARGDAPAWPFGAFSNGFFAFCSGEERRSLFAAVVEALPMASPTRRPQLVSFACRVGPNSTLELLDKALGRKELTPLQQKTWRAAREKLTPCRRRGSS
ncbi:MAG TPA: hypothetical protein VGX68_14545 [Thermoanaerobaculia bacterium]|nr:hypothetical protein [Thermoanaerobaculia bacterium]